MAGLERADHVAAAHHVSLGHGGRHRFEARQQPARVGYRDERPVDHDAGEMHGAVGRRAHDGVGRADVDAAVPGRVAGRRR